VAEHAVALLLALNRKLHRAYNRVRNPTFPSMAWSVFDLHGKTWELWGREKSAPCSRKSWPGLDAGFGL